MPTIKEDRIKKQSRLYEKLSVQVNHEISSLRNLKKNAEGKKNDPKLSEATRNIWFGIYTAYNNALIDLELANERAHYDFKSEGENKMEAPKYQHDCENCMFLGNHEFKNNGLVPKGNHDFYACPQVSIPTIIIRYGNDGPSYASGMSFIIQAIDGYYGEKTK